MAPSIMAHPALARVPLRLFDSGNAIIRPRPTMVAQSAGRKQHGVRKPARAEKSIPASKENGRPATSHREVAALVSARSILGVCMAATSPIEVTRHFRVERNGRHSYLRPFRH